MADRLRPFFCDHLSILRGKYLPAAKIGDDATRFCRSTFGVHYDKELLPAPGAMMMEGLPDMTLSWKAAEIRDGWEPRTKVVMGDLFDQDGTPLPMCPRGALKRALDGWQTHGLSPKIGIELEAYAFTRNAEGQIVPYDTPGGVVYGTGPYADPLGFNDAIWDMAEQAGFRLDLITNEYDHPQYEYTLGYDSALAAVDAAVLFRQAAREVAFKHGIILTFLPKPIPGKGGSGMHVNFSFANAQGHNALSNGPIGGPEYLTDLARGCVAGLVHHHKGLAGLIAPTAGSYLRLQPASLSGFWRNWGGDHRNVTTRVSAEGGAKARLEHRMADASANPYTAVAAVLQAARLGYEGKYPLPPKETGDGFAATDTDQGTATDLAGAIADLIADTALSSAVGQGLVDNHAFMKQQEVVKTADLSPDALRDFYIHFV